MATVLPCAYQGDPSGRFRGPDDPMDLQDQAGWKGIPVGPEGHDLGCGTGWARRWVRGFRLELGIRWGYGITSTRETWSGGSWTSPAALPTARAHSEIWTGRAQWREGGAAGGTAACRCGVAQAFEVGLSLRDTRGSRILGWNSHWCPGGLVRNVSLIQAPLPPEWGISPWGCRGVNDE